MLATYQRAFERLKSDRVTGRWPDITNKRAPHKPFLLLSVLDLFAQYAVNINLIELRAELLDTFDLYWLKVMGNEKPGSAVLPFYHLKSEGFWHLIAQPDQETLLRTSRQIRSLRDLHELVLGARLDDELFTLLQSSDSRDALRRTLIETYFAPEIRPILVEVGTISQESFEYSRELLDRARGIFRIEEAPTMDEMYLTDSRSVGFRKVVVEAYDHTCAVCGVRLRTPEGRTAVAASHIVPWSHSHNDDPRNGLALCGLHHWSFDQGMITVLLSHEIAVSTTIAAEPSTESIQLLNGQRIRLPNNAYLHPAREALRWHNKNVFRTDTLRRLF